MDIREQDFRATLDDYFKKLTKEQIKKALDIFDNNLDKYLFVKEYNELGFYHFVGMHHFFWGMGVRNLLRQNGFTDEFAGGNLDDYYIQLLEKWAGLRYNETP